MNRVPLPVISKIRKALKTHDEWIAVYRYKCGVLIGRSGFRLSNRAALVEEMKKMKFSICFENEEQIFFITNDN